MKVLIKLDKWTEFEYIFPVLTYQSEKWICFYVLSMNTNKHNSL